VRGATTIVAHTTTLTLHLAFVRTDEVIDIGTVIDVRLSFRGALPNACFRGTVTEHRAASGPGEYAGLWLSLEPHTADDLDRLREVLDMAPPSRLLRLLYVEDSSITRDVFAHFASKARFQAQIELDAVANAELAWERLREGGYDLVLVDHFLPQATGADLIGWIRTDERLAGLPIIGLSVGGSVARDAMVSAGVDVFLDKPVQPRDVLTTLDRLAGLGTRS
jgi:CheY-like chemotaxis protein